MFKMYRNYKLALVVLYLNTFDCIACMTHTAFYNSQLVKPIFSNSRANESASVILKSHIDKDTISLYFNCLGSTIRLQTEISVLTLYKGLVVGPKAICCQAYNTFALGHKAADVLL